MNSLEEIRRQWQIAQVSKEGALRLWDHFAQRQSSVSPVSPEANRSLAIVTENAMVDSTSHVLDLGCGNGRYSLWFARNCGQVTGIDLSGRALRAARAAADAEGLSNLTLVEDDWHSLELETYGWEGAFDLVYCHTSPAVQSAETFEKLLRASRKWCYMSKPTHRAEPTTRYLCRQLQIEHWHRPFEWDMMYAYDWLYMEGYEPKVDYIHENWTSRRPLEQACEYYSAWLETNYGLPASREPEIREALDKIAVDGMIIEEESMIISILYWKVS